MERSMPCPSGTGMIGRLLFRNLGEFAFNDIVSPVARCRIPKIWLTGARPHFKSGDVDALAGPIENSGAHRGCEKGETDNIGEKSRCQKQRTGNEDHGSMCKRLARVIKLRETAAQVFYRPTALRTDQPSDDERGQDNDGQGWPQTNRPPNLDEQGNFDQWHKQKGQK